MNGPACQATATTAAIRMLENMRRTLRAPESPVRSDTEFEVYDDLR